MYQHLDSKCHKFHAMGKLYFDAICENLLFDPSRWFELTQGRVSSLISPLCPRRLLGPV